MKIEELFHNAHNEEKLPQTQKKVFALFKKFPEEVFPYPHKWDKKLVEEVGLKTSTASWSLYILNEKGFLDREKVDRITYFGLPKTISRLREEKHKREKEKSS